MKSMNTSTAPYTSHVCKHSGHSESGARRGQESNESLAHTCTNGDTDEQLAHNRHKRVSINNIKRITELLTDTGGFKSTALSVSVTVMMLA